MTQRGGDREVAQVSAMAPTREWLHRSRLVAMNDRDLDDFTELLLRKFPGVKFLPRSYWEQLPETGPRKRKEPPNLSIDYFDTLSDPRTKLKRIWIEPPGWEPFWLGPNENGIYFIANAPHLQVSIDCGGVARLGTPRNFRHGEIVGTYARGDRQHKAFIDAVIRLSEKLTTNVAKIVDRNTHKTLFEATRTMIWLGRDVIRWMREDPRRTVWESLRPVDESFQGKPTPL